MILGIFIGAFIWLLFELNKAYSKPDFSFKKFILLNWIPLVTNILCGITIIWFRDDIEQYFTITKINSVILGMSGQAIFKKIVGIFDKNIETHIGINKPSK